MKKTLKLKFYTIQSQKTKNFSFFSVLKSPHVNKKSQEQFEYYKYSKRLKIHVSQLTKFIFIWKRVKIKLFADINIKTYFLLDEKLFTGILLDKVNYDNFVPSFFPKTNRHERQTKKKTLVSRITKQLFLKLSDIHGEKLLKSLF